MGAEDSPEAQRGMPVEPRPSASMILLRDSADGPEVLLVERHREQRFMGGAWVFPGGVAHEDDAGEPATALRELEEEAGIALPEGAEVVRFSRWITPAEVDQRFDTHFFLARAPDGCQPVVDGRECTDVRWMRPQEALDAGECGALRLVFPTIKHLEELARFSSVAEALEVARARRVMPVEPKLLVRGGVAQVLMPGEAGHER